MHASSIYLHSSSLFHWCTWFELPKVRWSYSPAFSYQRHYLSDAEFSYRAWPSRAVSSGMMESDLTV
jgi:hypothetical protein